jgi:hypothetical protein
VKARSSFSSVLSSELFAALDVMAGTVIGACERRHRGVKVRAFLDRVERSVPPDVRVLLDNWRRARPGWSEG